MSSNPEWKERALDSIYYFPDVLEVDPKNGDLITIGADLDVSTLLNAYSRGLFPMHIDIENNGSKNTIGWFSPVKRAIIPLDKLRVTRSMKKSYKKYECRIDSCFEEMMRLCMTVPRENGWIDEEFVQAYIELHKQGYAHSVETFLDGELVGGLYGVSIAGFFAGESMVHTKRDASKVALMHLVEKLKETKCELLDAQWMTAHLATLGTIEVTRSKYMELLDSALKVAHRSW